MHRYRILIGSAMLAVVSVLLQVYKVAYPWGVIDIDVVGVPWLVSTFLFGIYGGIITAIVSAVGIAVFAPTGPIGAAMKLAATIIMVFIVGVVGRALGFGKKGIAIAFVACLVARPVLMLLFNYFVGIPIFFGIPTDVAIQQFPVEVLIVPNMVLAATDFWIAYALVFGTKLRERVK